ncbi:MAG: hypothetical protein AABX29_01605 [Nanoarchaeota archaeon]
MQNDLEQLESRIKEEVTHLSDDALRREYATVIEGAAYSLPSSTEPIVNLEGFSVDDISTILAYNRKTNTYKFTRRVVMENRDAMLKVKGLKGEKRDVPALDVLLTAYYGLVVIKEFCKRAKVDIDF